MSNSNRLLLSHNFALLSGQASALSRNEFADIFIEGLQTHSDCQCRLIDHPHWIVEIVFNEQQILFRCQ